MLTNCLYFTSDDLTADAIIQETGQDEKGAFIVCDRTVFHAQGGGQKSDRGTIDTIDVIAVAKRGTPQEFSVLHYLAAPLAKSRGASVSMQVDGKARTEHSRLHSLGHLLAHVTEDHYPHLKAVQGHHWPNESRVEFLLLQPDGPMVDEARLNEFLAQAIHDDLPIVSQLTPAEGRTIQIGTYAPVPCGGTHLPSTRTLEKAQLRGAKIKGDRLRIKYD